MTPRVLGCDLDGVIFDFNTSFISLLNGLFGTKIPPVSTGYPDSWNYPLDGGYVNREQWRAVWDLLNSSHGVAFWRNLPAYFWSQSFLEAARQQFDDVAYITVRPELASGATIEALQALGVERPKVFVVADNKARTLADLGVTHFLDDRDKNFDECCHLPGVALYMLDQPWNRGYVNRNVRRVTTPFAVLSSAASTTA